VYATSLEEKAEWQRAADEAGMSLSRYVIEVVRRAAGKPVDFGAPSERDDERQKEILDLQQQVADVSARLGQKEELVERLDDQLEKYRIEAILHTTKPKKQIDPRLLRVLESSRTSAGIPKPVDEDAIIDRLGLKRRDAEALAALRYQLDTLVLHGLAKLDHRGWRLAA
jgi:hypothetical protein